MDNLIKTKNILCTLLGVVGGVLFNALGGKTSLTTGFLIVMSADYITGLIVALVFKNSPKTDTGGAQSRAGFIGLVKKVYILIIIVVVNQVDIILGTNGFVRNSVITGFMVNELISIVENAGLMNLKLPTALFNAIDVLKKKSEESNSKEAQ